MPETEQLPCTQVTQGLSTGLVGAAASSTGASACARIGML